MKNNFETDKNKFNKKIFVANDHAGFQLKCFLMKNNPEHQWEDLGITNEEPSNYPEQAEKLCRRILKDQADDNSLGLLICGSGQGMAIKANRFSNIRAVVAWNKDSALLAREHNKANVLCLGARLIPFETANDIFKTFIRADFKGGRHRERVQLLN